MSVIIKGAYPPIDCESCSYRGIVKCSPNYYSGTIPAGCPVHEIPPHGRLIDADELLRHKGDAYDSEGHLLYAVGTGSIIAAPTVIEAEEGAEE